MMDFRKNLMAQQIINSAIRTEKLCLEKSRIALLSGSLLALIMVPIAIIGAMITFVIIGG